MKMITDEQSLVGAKSKFGSSIKTWDDGIGPLWVYRESLGIVGIVRAQSYEDAYECVLDEILTPIDSAEITADPSEFYVCERDYNCEAPKDYEKGLCLCYLAENSHYRQCWKCKQTSARPDIERQFHDPRNCACTALGAIHTVHLTLAEGLHYQPNATGSGIVATDLNGEALDQLTPELLERLEITLLTL